MNYRLMLYRLRMERLLIGFHQIQEASQNMDGYLAGFQLSPIYEQDSLQFFVDLQNLQNFHKLEPQQFLQKKLRRAYQQLMMKPLQIQDL